MNLKEYFQKAKDEKWAIGHFNFSTADQLKAIVESAAELKSPVMVATSEGEEKFIGLEQAVALVQSWQDLGYPVFLNADHHKSWESVSPCIDEGYDTVLVDASKLPYEENVELTKKVVEYSKSVDPDMMIEGELGYMKGESEIEKKVDISPADYTKPEQAVDFVKRTGVDRLAIVFGNINGIVTEQVEKLDITHLKRVVAAVPETFLVLHGASGLKDEDIATSIKAGIVNVHFNTELRLAYREGIDKALHAKPDESAPYKYLALAVEDVKKVVAEKVKLFMS